MSFNYEQAELDKLSNHGPFKVKLYDDAGNSTHWLTLDTATYVAIRGLLVAQGVKG